VSQIAPLEILDSFAALSFGHFFILSVRKSASSLAYTYKMQLFFIFGFIFSFYNSCLFCTWL